MSIQKRIVELERKFHGNTITLMMDDGTEQTIRLGRGQDAADLFVRTLNDPNSTEANAIRESISAVEPGGSRICELIRALSGGEN
jgi:hypothetical protein